MEQGWSRTGARRGAAAQGGSRPWHEHTEQPESCWAKSRPAALPAQAGGAVSPVACSRLAALVGLPGD